MNAANVGQLRRPARSRDPSPATQRGTENQENSQNVPSKNRRSGSWAGTNESDDEIEALGYRTSINHTMSGDVPGIGFCYGPQVSLSPHVEDRMQRKLRFYFMNPIEKWQAKRRFPYKLLVQITKVILVTAQLCLFATYRYSHVNFYRDNKITFSHLFIKGWEPTREVHFYPPGVGPLAIYKKEQFFEYIDYAVNAYADIKNVAIGAFSYIKENGTRAPVEFCLSHYKEGDIHMFNKSSVFDNTVITSCISIPNDPLNSSHHENFSSKIFFEENNFTIEFSAFISSSLKFAFRTINPKPLGPLDAPDCYQFNISLNFENGDHDGQVPVTLDMVPIHLLCNETVSFRKHSNEESHIRSVINYVVIVISSLSLILC